MRKYEELVLMLYINQKYLYQHLSILFLYYDIKFIKKDHKEGKLLAEKSGMRRAMECRVRGMERIFVRCRQLCQSM